MIFSSWIYHVPAYNTNIYIIFNKKSKEFYAHATRILKNKHDRQRASPYFMRFRLILSKIYPPIINGYENSSQLLLWLRTIFYREKNKCLRASKYTDVSLDYKAWILVHKHYPCKYWKLNYINWKRAAIIKKKKKKIVGL